MPKRRITVLPSATETALGFCFLPFQQLLLGSLIARTARRLHIPINNLSLNLICFSISAVVVAAVFRHLHRENFRIFRADPKGIVKAALLIALPLYLAASLGVNSLVAAIEPDFVNRNNSVVYAMLGENFAAMLAVCVVLAPLVEETLFRGLVFGALAPTSRAMAYTASIVLFGAVHVMGHLSEMTPWHALLSTLQYVPASVVFCVLYERTNCLWAPVVLHAAVNLLSCVTVGLFGG